MFKRSVSLLLLTAGILMTVLNPLNSQPIRSFVKREAKIQEVGNFLSMNPTSESEVESDNFNVEYSETEMEPGKLDGLTNPQDYYIWWLPGLNKLGLLLDILKAKIAKLYLNHLHKIKSGDSCKEQESLVIIDESSKQIDTILRNMTATSELIKIVKDPVEFENYDHAIPKVLLQSIDTLIVRSQVNEVIITVANFLKSERGNNSCKWNAETRKELDIYIDEAINEYWFQVLPVASSVYWDEYNNRDKLKLGQLIDDMFS